MAYRLDANCKRCHKHYTISFERIGQCLDKVCSECNTRHSYFYIDIGDARLLTYTIFVYVDGNEYRFVYDTRNKTTSIFKTIVNWDASIQVTASKIIEFDHVIEYKDLVKRIKTIEVFS